MLKTPSQLQSRGSPPMGALQPPAGAGAGNSPAFRWSFLRSSFMSPTSFHLMPESCTAMTTSGRPVARRQAMSTLMPLLPLSSFALPVTTGSVVQKFVLAYFHFWPLQLPAAPLISFGSAMQPAGSPELSQRVQVPVPTPVQQAAGAPRPVQLALITASSAKGNSARAESATRSVRLAAATELRRIDGSP